VDRVGFKDLILWLDAVGAEAWKITEWAVTLLDAVRLNGAGFTGTMESTVESTVCNDKAKDGFTVCAMNDSTIVNGWTSQ